MFPRDKKMDPPNGLPARTGNWVLGYQHGCTIQVSWAKLSDFAVCTVSYPPGRSGDSCTQKQGSLLSRRWEENPLVRDGGRKAQSVKRQLAGGTEKADADDGLARF